MSGSNPLRRKQFASAVFFPRPDSPFGYRAKNAGDHLFKTPDGIILRLRLFLADPKSAVILFFHGNGETARDYDSVAALYNRLPASFAVAEYRGYGPSTGEPSLFTFLPDALATLDELKAVLAERGYDGPIVVMGRSLGSAPAIEVAYSRTHEICGLIIESGFARIVPLLELLGIPAGAFGINESHGPGNLEKMGALSLPTLIIHAEQDQIIPIADARSLFEASKDPSRAFLRVPQAGHNDLQLHAGDAYFENINRLLARIR